MNVELLCGRFGIEGELRDAALRAHAAIRKIDYDAQQQVKASVLQAFLEEGLAESDLHGTTGYGYDDATRERYQNLLARIFGTQRALAQLSLVSGTHAIVASIAACVPHGKTLLSISGAPYDTLRNAIVDHQHSLVRGGIGYREVALAGSRCYLPAIEKALEDPQIVAVFLQRSRGYAPRPSLHIDACAQAFALVKKLRPDVTILVDNCYGELVEEKEPSHVGADIVIGSLIKNLGGTIAPGGAYVAGRKDLIERIASYTSAPGLGGKLGPTFDFGRQFFGGLFLAPAIVEQCLRGLDFAAALFAELGYDVDPMAGSVRTDIVQAIRLGSAQKLQAFAQGLQSALPVNARFRPQPGAVPGYEDKVLMSSGAFVAGSTLELSCDAPLREPYEVYLQGGAFAEHTAVGALFAAQALRA